MKNWMIALLMNVIQVVSAQAAPALFEDNVLTLGDAIVIEGATPRYYQDVRLSPTPSGDFKVLGATEKALAMVTELTVTVIETEPVQVEVGVIGYMANPCIELNTAVTRKGSTFYVVVGENPLQTLVACAQVIQPYELEIPLNVKGLPSGDYVVMVNGDSIEFDLD